MRQAIYSAVITKRTPEGNRMWTDADMRFVMVDVFTDGFQTEQRIHLPGDACFAPLMEILMNDTEGYTAWPWFTLGELQARQSRQA